MTYYHAGIILCEMTNLRLSSNCSNSPRWSLARNWHGSPNWLAIDVCHFIAKVYGKGSDIA
jgi:hypothetical protein